MATSVSSTSEVKLPQVSDLPMQFADSFRSHETDVLDNGKAKVHDEDYFLSQNPTEVERLSYQHEVIKDYMGGNLVLAPVDLSEHGLHIFDSATADGLWLRDLQSSLPEPQTNQNTYTGTDIVPSYFPTPIPESTALVIHNMTAPYPSSWAGHFHLVHQRLALPGCGSYPLRAAVASLVTLLRPGGWIQLLEADHSGPGSGNSAIKNVFKLIKELFGKSGIDYEYARLMKGWLLEMGLEMVEERVLEVPLGKSNENKILGEMGAKSFGLAAAGLVRFARSVSTSFSVEELDDMPAHVEKELMNVGAVHRIYAVWGRRPIEVKVISKGGCAQDGDVGQYNGGCAEGKGDIVVEKGNAVEFL